MTLSGNLIAKERRGAQLIVQKKDGEQVRGELIAVKENSLLLLDAGTGADVTVNISDIKVARIKESSKLSKFLLGLGTGFLTGAALVYLINSSVSNDWNRLANMESNYLLLGGFTLCGAIGGTVAAFDETIQIEGKSDSEIKEALEKLRKKARIPDYE